MKKPTLYLYRGIPGSGKTTAAHKNHDVDFVFEADQYFWLEGVRGVFFYEFDAARLQDAHAHCLWRTMIALQKGYSVAVANTFTQRWEMDSYLKFAADNDIPVVVYRMTKEYGSIHNVPEDKIKLMKARFQAYDGEILV